MYVGPITYSVGAILVCLWLLNTIVSRWLAAKREPGEPEFIRSAVPFIGHAIGLFVSREKYYRNLRARRRDLPIYGIDILGSKQYIVNDPSLAVAVQRQARNFSFNAYGVKLAKSICGLSDSMMTMMDKGLDVPGNTNNFAYHFFRDTHASLGLGSRLDQLLHISIPSLVEAINDIAGHDTTPDHKEQYASGEIHLSAWLRYNIIKASTSAVYGVLNNPFKSTQMRFAYDTFENSILMFILSLPRFLIPKAYLAQQITADGMIEYLKRGHYQTGSDYIQSRYDLGYKYGATSEDIARLDLGGVASLNSSTSPASFWVMANIIARPNLLQEIRAEILKNVALVSTSSHTECSESSNSESLVLDASSLWQASPLLVSAFKETLRYHALGSTVRLVLEDTWVGNSAPESEGSTEYHTDLGGQRYLLKKGGLIIIPSASIHADPQIWGNTASEFDPTRFLEQQVNKGDDVDGNENLHAKISKPPKGAFRGFGGGSSLCPGRHWATIQILTVVTVTILMYDMHFIDENDNRSTGNPSITQYLTSRPPLKGTTLTTEKISLIPPPVKSKMTMTVENPAHDVRVHFTRRPEWQGKTCKVAINPKWQVPDIIRFGE